MAISATRSRENTRARLLEAAAQVFAEIGLDGATVEVVCERAGFTRGAFYSNFESKDKLFFALFASVADEQLQSVRSRVAGLSASPALAQAESPLSLVQQVMDSGEYDRVGVMLMSEIRIRALRDPELGQAYLLQERAMLDSIAQIVGDIVNLGLVTLRVPAEDAAKMLLIMWEGIALRAAMGQQSDQDMRQACDEELAQLVHLLVAT